MKLNTQPHQKTDNSFIFLFGPTAVGKTELLCSLFSRSCEVVNADSIQVYRHLDIGSAKAGKKEQQIIAHHLIDIRDPWQSWNVNDFISNADRVCKDIHGRGKIPVISGGTAFYFKSFLYGLSDAPPADPLVRQHVAELVKDLGKQGAHDYLEKIDPVSAQRININDTYRVSRAIEVYMTSGKSLSSFTVPAEIRNKMNVLAIGLYCDKKILSQRIRQRVAEMTENGLKEEIEKLLEMGASSSWQSMQGIGYREFMKRLENGKLPENLDMQEVAEEIAMNSIHYAKRQMTFFRSFENVRWVDIADKKALVCLLKESFPDLPEDSWPSEDQV